MELSRRRWLLAAFLFAAALSLFVPLPQPIRFMFGFFQAFYLPGFVFLAFLGHREGSWLDDLFMPLVLSPIVVVILMLAARAATPAFHSCLIVAFSALYVLLAIALAMGRFARPVSTSAVPRAIVFESIAFSVLIIVTYLVNDSLFALDTSRQAAVSYEILYRGFPPQEPFFADIPIKNMWFQYLFHATWHSLSGVSLLRSMWIVNIVCAFAFPYVVARFAAVFTARRGYLLAAPLFAVAGLDAASWVLWPQNLARAFFGASRGWPEIAAIVDEIRLDGRAVLQFLTPPGAHSMNLMDKFLIIDVHQYSVMLFLLCLTFALERKIRARSRIKAAAAILLVMTGAFLFRIVTGLALVSSALLAGVIALVRGRLARTGGASSFQSLVVPGLAALVGTCGLLFYRNMTGAWGDGIFVPDRFAVSVRNLITIALPLVVLLPFSKDALARILSGETAELRTLAAWVVALVIASACIDLRGTLESYFLYPLALILVIFIGWRMLERIGAARGGRRALLIAWTLILFIVPPVLTVRGYTLDRPSGAHYERRYRISEDDRKLYEWIRNDTDIKAVFIEKNEYNVMTYYTGRKNFSMTTWELPNFGYRGEMVERYRAVRDDLYSESPISPATMEFLEGLPFDVYVVLWAEDLASRPDLAPRFASRPDWFRPVFENPAGAVYLVVKS